MEVIRIETGFLKENCYVLIIDNDCLIIDPGSDYNLIKKKIRNYNVLGVLITHSHFDHIGALDEVLKDYSVPVFKYDNLEEKKYEIGKFKFEVIFNPGHSMDSVSYFFKKERKMFVGDFVFKKTIGRCDLKGGNFSLMSKSINKLKRYSNVELYPGHGENTNIDFEIENNPFF